MSLDPVYGQFPVPNETDFKAKYISLQSSKPVDRLILGNLATVTGQPHTIKELEHMKTVEFNHSNAIPRYDPSFGQSVIVQFPNIYHFFN